MGTVKSFDVNKTSGGLNHSATQPLCLSVSASNLWKQVLFLPDSISRGQYSRAPLLPDDLCYKFPDDLVA